LLVLSLSYCPGTHWTLTEQNGWPVRSWYLPFGHEVQEAEFDTLENLPATHAWQMRFEVLEGLESTCKPAAQVVCAMQNVLPAWLWNSVAPHAMQAAVLLSPEYCPAGQSRQRSGVLLVLSLSYCPGTHWTLTEQNGWPVCNWYLPVGHRMHVALAASPWKESGSHGMQPSWPGLSWYLPGGHSSLMPLLDQ
jgi:hypothetical protein